MKIAAAWALRDFGANLIVCAGLATLASALMCFVARLSFIAGASPQSLFAGLVLFSAGAATLSTMWSARKAPWK